MIESVGHMWTCEFCSDDVTQVMNPDSSAFCLACNTARKPKTGANSGSYSLKGTDTQKPLKRGLIRFTVHGQPQAKKRPRFNGRRAYTPKATRDYEELVQQAASLAIAEPFTEPVFVYLSIYRKYRYRVDIDNITKAVMDGMNKVAYSDDFLVRKLFVDYQDGQSEPRVCITITDIANWIQVLQFISKDSEAA